MLGILHEHTWLPDTRHFADFRPLDDSSEILVCYWAFSLEVIEVPVENPANYPAVCSQTYERKGGTELSSDGKPQKKLKENQDGERDNSSVVGLTQPLML